MNPLISIVIPVFNCDKFLEDTISSGFNSTYENLEVVLVNDWSTDNSLSCCKKWKELFPAKVQVVDQRNQGPSVARNTGIYQAKGKYILPLDGDDLIHPQYISEAVRVLESDSSIKVVYCKAEKFGKKTGVWNLKPFSLQSLAKDNMIFVSGIYRKSDWASIGGYDHRFIWGWEDWEFWINMLKKGGKVVQLPLTGFFYRIRDNSRRKSTNRQGKKMTLFLLNKKHPEFFQRYLRGHIRNPRGVSIPLNATLHLIKHMKMRCQVETKLLQKLIKSSEGKIKN